MKEFNKTNKGVIIMKYKGRTEECIRKMKERAYAQIGDPKALSRRRELHRLDPRPKMYSRARERCKITGVKFALKSYKDIPKPYKYCPLLNIPMFVGSGIATDNSPTLDRINNNKGYIKGNLQVISRKANQSKSNLSFNEYETMYFNMKKTNKGDGNARHI